MELNPENKKNKMKNLWEVAGSTLPARNRGHPPTYALCHAQNKA